MEVKLPKTTAAVASPDDADVCGAFYHEIENKKYEAYILLPPENANRILDDDDADRAAMHILAPTESVVQQALEQRYPSPFQGATYLLRVNDFPLNEAARKKLGRASWRYSRRDSGAEIAKDAFVKLPYPLVEDIGCEALAEISKTYGPIYVSNVNESHAEACGLVVSAQKEFDLVRLNYNPGAFARREYAAAQRQYEQLTAGAFPKTILLSLYKQLYTGAWPSIHPFKTAIDPPELSYSRGWGNGQSYHDRQVSLDDIDQLILLTKKLYGESWWRGNSNNYSRHDWKTDLKAALPYVAGIEAKVRTYIEKAARAQVESYHEHVRRGETYPPEITAESVYKSMMCAGDEKSKSRMRVCRFLRAEAKVLGLKVPGLPKPPVKPSREKNHAKEKKEVEVSRVAD